MFTGFHATLIRMYRNINSLLNFPEPWWSVLQFLEKNLSLKIQNGVISHLLLLLITLATILPILIGVLFHFTYRGSCALLVKALTILLFFNTKRLSIPQQLWNYLCHLRDPPTTHKQGKKRKGNAELMKTHALCFWNDCLR